MENSVPVKEENILQRRHSYLPELGEVFEPKPLERIKSASFGQ